MEVILSFRSHGHTANDQMVACVGECFLAFLARPGQNGCKSELEICNRIHRAGKCK